MATNNTVSIKHQKYLRRMWRVFVGTLVGGFLLFVILSFTIPSFEELENPKSRLATEVITSDGQLLGRYFTENRVPVDYKDLSPFLVKALIATEDVRYYKHCGIDAKALMRVAVKTMFMQDQSSGGGSTISQQLAKLLYKRPNVGNRITKVFVLGMTKFREWITAVKLERSYTKEEIIALYLNEFNFIHGAYGVKSASEIYFGKTQDKLTINEASMLVGMLKNPTLYNPKSRAADAKKRREQVLYNMKEANVISQKSYDTLRIKPIDLSKFQEMDHNEGPAPHFREYLRDDLKKILANIKKADGIPYDIYRDGLKVHTTIDSRIQRHAEEAARTQLAKLQTQLFKHWDKLDPWTYEAEGITEEDITKRTISLQRHVMESERYQSHRPAYLKKATELNLADHEIQRLLNIERDRTVLDKLVKSKIVTTATRDKYKKILGSSDWATIKTEWQAWTNFPEAIKVEFNKPTKMTVFAYTPTGTTDTIMSPLDSIRYYKMFLQTGVMAMDPHTGQVKAWVGGSDHKYFKYDHVNKSVARQIGSTFKPFLYALSIDLRGFSPCFQVIDQPVTIHRNEKRFHLIKDWTPKNAGGYSYASVTLQYALEQSINSVSAYLMKDLGDTEPLRKLVADMGIDTSRVPPQPSICLGTADLSVYEMTGAYSAFANEGVAVRPIYIARIEDRNGNILYEPMLEEKQVLTEQGAYVMMQMLKAVVGYRLGLKSEVGGKTGTTNFHADGWFMGLVPNLVVGTWVGCDDRFVRFRNLALGQGSYMARPIFADFMKRVENDKDLKWDISARFKQPKRALEIELDCTKYSTVSSFESFDEFSGAQFEREDHEFGEELEIELDPIEKADPVTPELDSTGGL